MEAGGWIVLVIVVALASVAFTVWLFRANRRDWNLSSQPFDTERAEAPGSSVE